MCFNVATGSQLPEDHPAREIVEKNIQLKMKIVSSQISP